MSVRKDQPKRNKVARELYLGDAKAKKTRLQQNAEYRIKNKEKIFYSQLKALYGITKEAYLKKKENQGNVCGICEIPFTSTPHVDHCHFTDLFRGLLCQHCNQGLGHFRDSVVLLSRAREYLQEFNESSLGNIASVSELRSME